MSNEFIVDDGLEEYLFKNTRGDIIAKFHFNGTDTSILTRYDDVQRKYNDLIIKDFDDEKTAEEIKNLEHEIKECFNELFGRNMDVELFNMYQPLAVFNNGNFYCQFIFERIEEIIENAFNTRLEKSKDKVKKATKKYIR